MAPHSPLIPAKHLARMTTHSPLIPAEAGIQKHQFGLSKKPPWTPAFAGVSGEGWRVIAVHGAA